MIAQGAAARRRAQPGIQASLRMQMTAVIALLAFLPNLVITVVTGPRMPGAALAAWIGLVALLSGMVAWLLSGVLLRPLTRLRSEVEDGDFSAPLSDDPTEIVALRGAFAGLLARLGTEQGRRNAFMATLVHDLKTPLIATGHLVHSLTHFDLTPEQKGEISDNLLTENRRLLTLVSQMADAHRFERDDVRLDPHPTDLRSLLDRVASRPGSAPVRVTVDGQGQAIVDAAVLERAVVNLADNALRYARSSVTLAVTAQGMAISDDGPGLSAALEDLAQPFNSQPALIAGKHYTAGTAGLGLFIARRIAEAHGGTLTYHRSVPTSDAEWAAAPAFSPAKALAPKAPGQVESSLLRSTFVLHLPEVTLDPPPTATPPERPERSAT